ncbi:hypothetical protein GIB67_016164 [Kingdonia uniflora]|uniref:ATP-dependent RNA helicase Ski2/MTR4 C-terminal domain-containing protein n=1 Tax=Kingdonia uniflora TaxID=39325 RepID=A0A7J7N9X2_9MAGN|nr:hypothetical protein GIB67_016164 [Kingdonia uniflora]
MDVIYCWSKGARFAEVIEMTDIFEGSIIRLSRRLDEFLNQEKRKRFKEMRKKQVLPYTSSRKGYARLENDMEKIEELKGSSGPNSSTPSFKDNILSKLFRPEQGGCVRELGFGVTPSSLEIISQNKGRVAELEEELTAVKEK